MDPRRLRACRHQNRPRIQETHHRRVNDRWRPGRQRYRTHHKPHLGRQHTYDSSPVPVPRGQPARLRAQEDEEAIHTGDTSIAVQRGGAHSTLRGGITSAGAGDQSHTAVYHFRAIEELGGEKEEGYAEGYIPARRDWEVNGD